jgi:hypothetical protein
MNFSEALIALKTDKKVQRQGWNGKGMWLGLISDPCTQLGAPSGWLPFICMKTAQGGFVPWLASQTDILAEDWETL